METKVVMKKEYRITLTKEEAETLCDILEYIPHKNSKRSKKEQERIEMVDCLYKYVLNMLESGCEYED